MPCGTTNRVRVRSDFGSGSDLRSKHDPLFRGTLDDQGALIAMMSAGNLAKANTGLQAGTLFGRLKGILMESGRITATGLIRLCFATRTSRKFMGK